MADFITVSTYNTRLEAEVAKGFLETNGIKALISADDAGGMRPFPMSYVMGVQLKVLQSDIKKAKKLLEDQKDTT